MEAEEVVDMVVEVVDMVEEESVDMVEELVETMVVLEVDSAIKEEWLGMQRGDMVVVEVTAVVEHLVVLVDYMVQAVVMVVTLVALVDKDILVVVVVTVVLSFLAMGMVTVTDAQQKKFRESKGMRVVKKP